MRGCALKQMHHYKTPTAAAPQQGMSHTVLKSAAQNSNRHTAFESVVGTIEVYWEQFRNRLASKTQKDDTAREEEDHGVNHVCAEQGQGTRSEWHKIGPKHTKRPSDCNSLKFASTFVFG